MNKYQLTMNQLTFLSLMAWSLGLFTSMTFLALSHIFIFIPIIYFMSFNFKQNIYSWKKSQWALLVLIGIVILSVILNQDVAVKGYSPISKVKYYLFGLLSVLPIQQWLQSLNGEEKKQKIKYIIYALLVTTTVASLYGMGRLFLNFNPLHLSYSDATRNTGFFGMVLNYAHNLAFFLLFIVWAIVHRGISKKYVSIPFLIFCLVVNFIALYTTYSRGALLAFLIAIPFLFFLNNIKNFLMTTIISVVVIYSVIHFFPSLNIVRPGSDFERVSQWKTAIYAFKERPVLGFGFLNFEKVCPALKVKYDIDQKQFCGHAHNIFLEMLASTGVLGLMALLTWLVLWIYEVIVRRDFLTDIVFPLIVVFVISGMTQATFSLGANLFLIMGIYSFSLLDISNEKSSSDL